MTLLQPSLLVLLVSGVLAGEVIHLKTRIVDPDQEPAELFLVPAPSRTPGRSHYLLQFFNPPRADQLRQLNVVGYVYDSAVSVAMDEGLVMEGGEIRWAGRLAEQDKISPLLQSAGESGGMIVEFHPDIGLEEARALVLDTGLSLFEHPDLLRNHLLVMGPLAQVLALSEWDEVAYIFPASNDLALGHRVHACAGPLTEAGLVGQYVKVGQGWSAVPHGVELGYAFGNLTAKLAASSAQSEVLRALYEWAQHTKLTFVAGNNVSASRTISVLWARGPHGDQYPFDGPGKVLAHTFYPSPPNPEPIAGDIHFDEDENWRIGATVDLFTVALHEAGHALGLGHSDDSASVMYPYYRFGAMLSADDIAGIRDLYGNADAPPPAPPAPPDPKPPAPPAPKPPAPPPPGPPASADTTAPSLQITFPALSIVSTSENSITIRGTASDNVAVTLITWQNSAGGSGNASGTATWSASVPVVTGTNAITIRAFDAAGNTGWRSLTVVRR